MPNVASICKSKVNKKDSQNTIVLNEEVYISQLKGFISIWGREEAPNVTTRGINLDGLNNNMLMSDSSWISNVYMKLLIHVFLWLKIWCDKFSTQCTARSTNDHFLSKVGGFADRVQHIFGLHSLSMISKCGPLWISNGTNLEFHSRWDKWIWNAL